MPYWPTRFTIALNDARELVADSKPADRYADATIWLHNNAPEDTIVFQTDWDDFTRLFFYNSNAIYTAGLDPTFMELEDAAFFDQWVDITRGRVEQPGTIIRDEFGAGYVFSDLNHDSFIDEAEADPLLQEVYRDEHAVIYAVGELTMGQAIGKALLIRYTCIIPAPTREQLPSILNIYVNN